MKKLLVLLLSLLFTTALYADTETIKWYVDGSVYNTTTCQTGGDINLPLAPTKYGYTFQGWREKSYTPLEYIEATGIQYIDTGYFPNKDTSVKIAYMRTDTINQNMAVLGCADYGDASNSKNGLVRLLVPNRIGFGGNESGTVTTISEGDTTRIKYELYYNKNVVSIKDIHTWTFPTNGEWFANYTLFLFARNTSGRMEFPFRGRIYYCQIWDGENLSHNLIPAIKNNTVGMYDTVTKIFFTNSGTGNFIAGPEVE